MSSVEAMSENERMLRLMVAIQPMDPRNRDLLLQCADEIARLHALVACPWQPMMTAPKDGSTVLVLMDGSNTPRAMEWLYANDECATEGAGWYMTWDHYRLTDFDAPRYWMYCPDDPDA